MTPAAALRRRLVTVAVVFVLLVAVAVNGVLYASLRSGQFGDLHGAFLRRLLLIEAVGTLAAVALATVLFRTVASSVLRPLEKMLEVVRGQAAGDHGQRIRPEPDCLVGSLGRAYDDMIDSQEAAIAQTKAARDRSRNFLADAAHQIRTPIAGIQAGAETLLLRPHFARPDEEQVLSELLQETSRVGRLISDLLLAARLDQGMHLEPAPCDLLAVCSHEAQRIRNLEPGLEVTILTPDWDGSRPRLDTKAIHDIMANLLDHARRCATSKVTITLTKDDGTVEVGVADDGPELAEDLADRVFEPFASLDGHDRFGLGLPIARELARAHGGDLRYQAHTFLLSLPWGSDSARLDDGTPSRIGHRPASALTG